MKKEIVQTKEIAEMTKKDISETLQKDIVGTIKKEMIEKKMKVRKL